MKFLADMGISLQTVRFLRELGHDAVHLRDEQLDEMPDGGILLKARREQRILLTHDLDFGELLAASSHELPSVITFRLRNMKPANVNYHLDRLLANHSEPLQQGSVMTVTEGFVRVRRLPITRQKGQDAGDQ